MDLNKSLTEDDYKKIHFGTLHVFESVCFYYKGQNLHWQHPTKYVAGNEALV
jgi:hypothetical protein